MNETKNRYKSMKLQLTNFLKTKTPKYTLKKRHLQQMLLGNQDFNMQKNKTKSLFLTLHKTQVQMHQRPQPKT